MIVFGLTSLSWECDQCRAWALPFFADGTVLQDDLHYHLALCLDVARHMVFHHLDGS